MNKAWAITGKTVNTHNGHTATCLCCKNLEAVEGQREYSEWTPGEPPAARCRHNSDMPDINFDTTGLFEFFHDTGMTCPYFDPKD